MRRATKGHVKTCTGVLRTIWGSGSLPPGAKTEGGGESQAEGAAVWGALGGGRRSRHTEGLDRGWSLSLDAAAAKVGNALGLSPAALPPAARHPWAARRLPPQLLL